MIIQENSVNTWVITLKEFEKFSIKGFLPQHSIARIYTDHSNIDNKKREDIFNKICEMIIGDIVKIPMANILTKIDIRKLPVETRQGMVKAVYKELDYRLQNNKVFLDADNNSIRLAGVDISSNANNPMLSVDMISFNCKKEIDNSGIKNYVLRRIEGYQTLGSYTIDKYGNYKEVI